jgi:16S rRNA (guanine966-N2)-methyltransferase
MTRIIAGSARGRRLRVPADGTRPTSDRVREALFSSLESVFPLPGSRVLDLYAGSGALGLEALSRGAAHVVLVDAARPAVAAMRENARSVGLDGAEVRRADATDYLQRVAHEFDLVLADPPYDLADDEVAVLLEMLTRGWLALSATVVVERSARRPEVPWPDGFRDTWQRVFGDTRLQRAVWYGRGEDP